VPQLGESIAEGTISKWLKKAGDTVRKDEPVVEIMTDKITVEVPAPTESTMGSITVEEGQTVAVGVGIAVLLKAGDSAGAAPATGAAPAAPAAKLATASAAGAAPAAGKPATAPSRTTVATPPPPSIPIPSAPAAAPRGGNGDARPGFLSPIVRRL